MQPLISASLIADVGATNVRFALLGMKGGAQGVRVFPCAQYASIEDAITAYLEGESASAILRGQHPRMAALAIAGPITCDQVALTNHPWSFSIRELRRWLGVDRLLVVNDFTAVAAAVPHLNPNDRIAIGGGSAIAAAPIGVIGPGSGLGVGGLIPVGGLWFALSGEGGHVTMAPATARESLVLEHMRNRFDHVSAERILSGAGLVNLYEMLAEISGVSAASYTPAQITDPTIGGQDPRCRAAIEMFCVMLGTVASNLAITLNAHGGIYIAGGIVPQLGPVFAASGFRARFEEKGRMRPILERIPTYVITHKFPAFLGLAALLFEKSMLTSDTNYRIEMHV